MICGEKKNDIEYNAPTVITSQSASVICRENLDSN